MQNTAQVPDFSLLNTAETSKTKLTLKPQPSGGKVGFAISTQLGGYTVKTKQINIFGSILVGYRISQYNT